jgi:hypothetical protein
VESGFSVKAEFLVKNLPEESFIPQRRVYDNIKSAGGVLNISINDFAERRVALIEDYSLVLTKDEQQRQYLLQVVEWHYRQYNCSNSSYNYLFRVIHSLLLYIHQVLIKYIDSCFIYCSWSVHIHSITVMFTPEVRCSNPGVSKVLQNVNDFIFLNQLLMVLLV